MFAAGPVVRRRLPKASLEVAVSKKVSCLTEGGAATALLILIVFKGSSYPGPSGPSSAPDPPPPCIVSI